MRARFVFFIILSIFAVISIIPIQIIAEDYGNRTNETDIDLENVTPIVVEQPYYQDNESKTNSENVPNASNIDRTPGSMEHNITEITGIVKFYNKNKSFGFIAGDDGKDYFFSKTSFKQEMNLSEGDKVTFDAVEGEKGPKAENLVPFYLTAQVVSGSRPASSNWAYWLNEGNKCYEDRFYNEALKSYEKAITEDKDNPDLWYSKGNALLKLKRYEEALKAYDSATKLDPHHSKAWSVKCIILNALNRTSDQEYACSQV